MDNIKISIIIPVYNRPKLLKRAVDSIPDRDDIETIIVNDGSTDDTAKDIIEKENLKVFTFEKNQGRSVARNYAINMAKGDYLFMLDSDDYIITKNFDKILSFLDKADLIFYDMIDNNDELINLNEESKILWCGATKLVRKSIVGKTRYPIGVELAEDLIFFDKIRRKNPTEFFTNIPLIHYNRPRKEEDGIK